MLAKKYRLMRRSDIGRVFRKGEYIPSSHLAIKIFRIPLMKTPRFTFVVSNKISKRAVVRNKIKRMMREAVRSLLSEIQCGCDIVILARPAILGDDLKDIAYSLHGLLRKARVL